jgi:hypothetical protein
MKGNLQRALLAREMTRKEFLQVVGASLVVLLGLPNFLKMMQRPEASADTQQDEAEHGFGIRKFGA